MKKMLIAIAVVVVGAVGCNRHSDTSVKSDTVGKAVLNTALQVSELDVSALSGMTDKLESACARNRYGLSEEACIQAIRSRKDVCMQQTAQKYPGQLSDADRMQEVVSSHVNCLFQQ